MISKAHASLTPIPYPVITGCLVAAATARLWFDFAGANRGLLLAAALGFLAGRFWLRPYWTISGLLVYLASPIPLPRLAAAAILLALVSLLLRFQARYEKWADILVGGSALILFLLTLSPGLLPADAGELQVIAASWGVAHPPGYPLYTVLAGLFAHLLPIQDPAWRINFFSALTGAAAVMLVARLVRRETGQALSGWVAGFALMTSLTFWMTATQASARPLSTLFLAFMLEAVFAYRRAVQQSASVRPALFRFGLAAGLGITHHGSIFFVGLWLALIIAITDLRAWKKWPIAIGGALFGILPWLYLPIRASGFLAPEGLKSWDGFWNHVLARGFTGDMFAFSAPSYWGSRWQVAGEVFRLQWHDGVLILALVGFAYGLYRQRWQTGTLIGVLVVHSFVALTYRAPQTVEYALPAVIPLAISLGWWSGTGKNTGRILFSTAALTVIAFSFWNGWVTLKRAAAQETARHAAKETLQSAAKDAVILAPWHYAAPLWYLQRVEQVRPDTQVIYVYPVGRLSPMETWTQLIDQRASGGQNVIAMQNFPEFYRYLPYTIENQTLSAFPRPIENPGNETPLGPVGLSPAGRMPSSAQTGATIHLQLTWIIHEPIPFGEVTTFIHIGDPDQPPFAQLDLPLQVPRLNGNAGVLRLDYDVFIPSTTPPGEWSIMAGAYTSAGSLPAPDGKSRMVLGKITLHPARFPLPTRHPVTKHMENIALRGWDYDLVTPDAARLYLHWALPMNDGAYQIRVYDPEGGLWSQAEAALTGSAGYWTSTHDLPLTIARLGVQIQVGSTAILIPPLRGEPHYIPFGDVAILTDWAVEIKDNHLVTELVWLPSGACFDEIQVSLNIQGDTHTQQESFTPVSGAVPCTKWAYGREIRSQQIFSLKNPEPLRRISLALYNSFTGRTVGDHVIFLAEQ